MIKIIPAILTSDINDLNEKLKSLSRLVDWVQIDIMDGKFVNSISISLKDLAKISLLKKFNIEVHLMVENPEEYFRDCEILGIKKVIFHFEAVEKLNDILEKAKKFSFQTEVALNPETDILKVQPYIAKTDLVVLLGVNPGFQGQKFISAVLNKVRVLKKVAPKVKIEVDGGINLSNITEIAKAKPDYLVIGSGLFDSKDIKERWQQLKEKIKS